MWKKNNANFTKTKKEERDASTKTIIKTYLQFQAFPMNFWGEGPFSDELILNYDI
ncbi:hypothetical protein [Maledivibacter halophilus]|uniref:Uncharacterized protein n=1 Tax=Maledivibacter halophilus TaxID=36842 RepID=A0A1T5KC87_9FIRM|nr:hypothetical protein [Maledivibacter halophilus]SKC61323.1 hypothetical protein SAMN02194393_01678 [Maledivibacter halophilus]